MKLLLLLAFVAAVSAKLHPLSDEFLEQLQSQQTTWQAGRNFAKDTPVGFLQRLACVRKSSSGRKLPLKETRIPEGLEIPDYFDSREQWPQCPTVSEIRDQGSCGSCWAMSAVTVMSDRTCIHSEGKLNVRYSAENVAACCTECGDGCFGGEEDDALSYWVETGVVSGGRYNSSEGCQPYSVPECEHHTEGPRPACTEDSPFLECQSTCRDGFEMEYADDLSYGQSAYMIDNDEAKIQNEVLSNGPVTSAFAVYDDFFSYKSGVYQHIQGGLAGFHAVRTIGWGEEDGTPYWLVANSWNTDWGDQGYFKILRGSDECGIEDDIAGAIPKLS